MQSKITKISLLNLCLFLIGMSSMYGQIGLRLKYNSNNFANWNNTIQSKYHIDDKIFTTGFELGLDYWFRLKKQRIEFMPELSYMVSKTDFDKVNGFSKFNSSGLSFNFHTQIYALDLEGDCNCPTFSKQGPSINKGLFFHLTPGITFLQTNGIPDINKPELPNYNQTVYKVGVGVGLDLGLSDLVTVTPIISYYFHSSIDWPDLAFANANLTQLQMTLRFGFRPDYSNKRRRRR